MKQNYKWVSFVSLEREKLERKPKGAAYSAGHIYLWMFSGKTLCMVVRVTRLSLLLKPLDYVKIGICGETIYHLESAWWKSKKNTLTRN
jgi:hypothetical protein